MSQTPDISAGFSARLTHALLRLSLEEGHNIGPTEFGKRVGKVLKRVVSQQTASKWLSGDTIPEELETIVACAQVTGVDPGWLTFDGASAAPAPSSWKDPPRGRGR